MNVLRYCSILVLVLALPGVALAEFFEINGVRPGMTRDRVIAKLKNDGYEVKNNGNSDGILAMRNGLIDTANFCDGKLSGYSVGMRGDVHDFIRHAKNFIDKRGIPVTEASSHQTNLGTIDTMSLSWVAPGDNRGLYYVIRLFYAPASGSLGESLSVRHDIKGGCP